MLHRELMKHWGYDYDMASNGLEAVKYAKKNNGKYDLCLMDVDMPVMNGIEATKIIRKTVKYFPIMALTANYGYKRECLAAGMDDFTEKPCLPGSLFAKINKITVKSYKLTAKLNGFCITEVMPMDQQHAKEIKKLKEKGLVKVSFGANVKDLILHENATNKISHDFNAKGHLMSVFLNHNPDEPTRCELYKEHCHITQTYLDDIDYDSESAQEKDEMEKYQTRTLKPENNDNAN
ncbi:response regulator [Nitrospira defluvii]|nr:response regulator [Nitrospira defluvii]